MNPLFQKALLRQDVDCPPIWMMRQAGRYHSHYQNLKKSYSFSQLCLNPELAAQVALGPIEDFDFDVAILFSDILFPLMAIGVDLIFEEFGGPKLQSPLNASVLLKAPSPDQAVRQMDFQKEALIQTRKVLPANKSLIGFVGGPFTLFAFATQGTHKNGIREAKLLAPSLWKPFADIMVPLLEKNIRLQFEGGAEVVMILDTAAGELGFEDLHEKVIEPLNQLTKAFPGKLAYYAKGLTNDGFSLVQKNVKGLCGVGIDHRLSLRNQLQASPGFVQGNFDPELMHLEHSVFLKQLRKWWDVQNFKNKKDLSGWVCGLGHGILPQTPEQNVRDFVKSIRAWTKELA